MAAAKSEPAPAAAAAANDKGAAAAKDAANAAPAAEAKASGKGGIAAFIPLIAVVILAPSLSWAVAQFVLLPQLKKELVVPLDPHAVKTAAAAEAPAAEEPAEGGKEGKEGKGKKGESGPASDTYEFSNVVVNLAGTMGTRYLKTTFMVKGDKSIRSTFEAKKPQLLDVTLNVLSALSLSDLEEAGAKNLIREKLIVAYNQALGKKAVEQVYFSDFVIQ